WANRRQLVNVTHQNQTSFGRQGPEELVHENDVNHRDFVDDEKVHVERMVSIALESAQTRLVFQQAVNRLCLSARSFAQAFRGPAGRGAYRTLKFLGRENLQDSADEGRLADAGSPGDNQDFVRGCLANGVALRVRQLQPHFLFDPVQGDVQVD